MFIFWFRKLKRSLRVCISNQQGWCPHFLHIESQVFRQLWSFYSVTRSHKYTKWQPWIERNLKVESNLKICMTNLSNSLVKNAQIWLWHVRTLRSSWSVFISWFCHLHAVWPLHDKLLQLYPTFCDPMHCSPPGSGPLSMGFSRHEYWIGLSSSSPGDLSDLEFEPASLASPSLAGTFFATSAILLKHYLTFLNLDVFRELCHLSHTVGLKISWNYVIKKSRS